MDADRPAVVAADAHVEAVEDQPGLLAGFQFPAVVRGHQVLRRDMQRGEAERFVAGLKCAEMQAAVVGLLFCMLCAQSQYALGNLASRDSETYITMGLQGFIFLAGERMILFIQSFVCVSHFIIHAARRQEAIRVSINQVSLLFLLALLIVQLIIAPGLSFGRDYILYIWTLHMDELFIFILVACAELILMIDQREYEEGR